MAIGINIKGGKVAGWGTGLRSFFRCNPCVPRLLSQIKIFIHFKYGPAYKCPESFPLVIFILLCYIFFIF